MAQTSPTAIPAGWTEKYYSNLDTTDHSAASDITAAITGAGWTSPSLAAGETYDLRAEVTPDTTVADAATLDILLKSILPSKPNLVDVVKASTTRQKLLTGIEYNLGDGSGWHTASTVESGSPATIAILDRQTIGLRPVLNPAYPAWPLEQPVWSIVGATGSHLEGDEIWVGYDDTTATSHQITATCGDSETVNIQVQPEDDN